MRFLIAHISAFSFRSPRNATVRPSNNMLYSLKASGIWPKTSCKRRVARTSFRNTSTGSLGLPPHCVKLSMTIFPVDKSTVSRDQVCLESSRLAFAELSLIGNGLVGGRRVTNAISHDERSSKKMPSLIRVVIEEASTGRACGRKRRSRTVLLSRRC